MPYFWLVRNCEHFIRFYFIMQKVSAHSVHASSHCLYRKINDKLNPGMQQTKWPYILAYGIYRVFTNEWCSFKS